MTQAEALKRECEQIIQRNGYYIRPNRMPDIMKAAQVEAAGDFIGTAGAGEGLRTLQMVVGRPGDSYRYRAEYNKYRDARKRREKEREMSVPSDLQA